MVKEVPQSPMTITVSGSCQDISINLRQTPSQAQDDQDVRPEDGTTITGQPICEEDTGQGNNVIQPLGIISSEQAILKEQPEATGHLISVEQDIQPLGSISFEQPSLQEQSEAAVTLVCEEDPTQSPKTITASGLCQDISVNML